MLSLTTLHAQERGKASYYSNSLQGRRMSSGLKYHRDSMFCAHKRYDLGQMLQVTNLSNGKSVVVKVADRGPHTRGWRRKSCQSSILNSRATWAPTTTNPNGNVLPRRIPLFRQLPKQKRRNTLPCPPIFIL